MEQLKTRPTKLSVSRFLASIPDPDIRRDCRTLSKVMGEATHARPKMRGKSIVGFGKYHYKYASGRQGEWFLTGFSPRKRDLTLYIIPGFEGYGTLLKQLGKHRTGRGCLYLKGLDDIHLPTWRKIISRSRRSLARRSA